MICRAAICEHGFLGTHDGNWKWKRNFVNLRWNSHILGVPKPKLLPIQNHYSTGRKAVNENDGGGGFNLMVSSERESEMSFYELLGISESGSFSEIKQAYKQLARKYHPDVSPCDKTKKEYTKRFIQLQEAYETLSDPTTRALYDRDLAMGLHLAFSARKHFHRRRPHYDDDEEGLMERRHDWKKQWESQLTELKRKSMKKDSGDNLSWAAQMRRKREK